MSRRTVPGTAGLTYVQANGGRLTTTTISPEIDKAYREIEAEFPELEVLCDHENEEHVIVEHCADGVQRLFKAWPWSQGFHVAQVRQWLYSSEGVDPLAAVDAANEMREREIDYNLGQRIGDMGQRLAFALAQDGVTIRPSMTPLSVEMQRARKIQNWQI
jgi:hypothetical protein